MAHPGYNIGHHGRPVVMLVSAIASDKSKPIQSCRLAFCASHDAVIVKVLGYKSRFLRNGDRQTDNIAMLTPRASVV